MGQEQRVLSADARGRCARARRGPRRRGSNDSGYIIDIHERRRSPRAATKQWGRSLPHRYATGRGRSSRACKVAAADAGPNEEEEPVREHHERAVSCAAGVARLARFNDVSRGTERGLAREVHGDSEGRKPGAQVPWRRCGVEEGSVGASRRWLHAGRTCEVVRITEGYQLNSPPHKPIAGRGGPQRPRGPRCSDRTCAKVL